MRFFLLGFMGTGKTYWGRLWADQHGMEFFDLDAEIERETGMTIREIFEQFGETYFREKEKQVLQRFGNRDNFILSTGGGTPCFYDNMQWMNGIGVTIYLDTPVQILKERLSKEKHHRPLIQNIDDIDLIPFIENNINKRNKFYNQAIVILSTESITETTFNEIKRTYT
jgi:shikimate kinase